MTTRIKSILAGLMVFAIILFGSTAKLATPVVAQGEGADLENIIGKTSPPPGVANFNPVGAAAGVEDIGIVVFISRVIRVFTVIAGVLVMLNFVSAGYTYITSAGDSGAQNKVRDQITMSIMGLAIMVFAYAIAAVISTLLFGDPSFILNPSIPTAIPPAAP